MHFIAECGIEYGCQIVTPFSFNSPDCLYIKKSCKFFQSYEKTARIPNLNFNLFCNDNLRQNKNDDSTAYGKYFAEVDSKEPLNLKGFARHMTSHGKIADYQMCELVLGQVVDCMSELLSQGQPVKLDGLGTFSPSVDGQKQGKNELAQAVAAGPDAMINGIKINFTPENIKGEKLTSRAFKEQCVFEFGYLVESEVRTVGGKQKRYQKKTPLSYVLAPAADNQGNG